MMMCIHYGGIGATLQNEIVTISSCFVTKIIFSSCFDKFNINNMSGGILRRAFSCFMATAL